MARVVKTADGSTPTPASFVNIYGDSIIASVPSKDSIEDDVTLDGIGTGSHAKLVICTPTSAGGQAYTCSGNKEVTLGKSYHLMLTINNDGSGSVYLNNIMIGTYSNPNLAGQILYLRVKASGRVNNDQVHATFSNIKLKYGGTYEDRAYSNYEFKTNPTINYTSSSWNNISFAGYISGLTAGQDWDNRYGSVSDIIQFVQ